MIVACIGCGAPVDTTQSYDGRPLCDACDETHCRRCADSFAWDGDSEESRVCPSCRSGDADALLEDS